MPLKKLPFLYKKIKVFWNNCGFSNLTRHKSFWKQFKKHQWTAGTFSNKKTVMIMIVILLDYQAFRSRVANLHNNRVIFPHSSGPLGKNPFQLRWVASSPGHSIVSSSLTLISNSSSLPCFFTHLSPFLAFFSLNHPGLSVV